MSWKDAAFLDVQGGQRSMHLIICFALDSNQAFLDVQGGQKSIQLVVCFTLQSARMSWKELADLEVQERQG